MVNTCSFLLAAVVVYAVASVATAADTSICPWRTVAHPEDPSVQNLGRWAVEQQHTALSFDKVESAKAQAVGDCANNINRIYELIVDASNRAGAGNGKYQAVVTVINRTEPQKVLSFAAVSPPLAK